MLLVMPELVDQHGPEIMDNVGRYLSPRDSAVHANPAHFPFAALRSVPTSGRDAAEIPSAKIPGPLLPSRHRPLAFMDRKGGIRKHLEGLSQGRCWPGTLPGSRPTAHAFTLAKLAHPNWTARSALLAELQQRKASTLIRGRPAHVAALASFVSECSCRIKGSRSAAGYFGCHVKDR